MMQVNFNSLGVLVSSSGFGNIRQGSSGLSLKAVFQDKQNINYNATVNFTRSDGTSTSDLIMSIDSTNANAFVFDFNSEWFFAKSGTTTLTVYLHDAGGTVIAQGQVQFNIEASDYGDEPTITRDEYNEILSFIRNVYGVVVSYDSSNNKIIVTLKDAHDNIIASDDAVVPSLGNTMPSIDYVGTNKTIADLYTYLTTNFGKKSAIVNLSGITESGIYSITISENSGAYNCEIERYAAGVRAAQDRWVGRSISSSITLDTLLTPYNEWFAPYLVNGNQFGSSTATLASVRGVIGDTPHIIGLTGFGYFLIKFDGADNFYAQKISSNSHGGDRWYGNGIATSTLIADVLKTTSAYYHPFLEVVDFNASNKTLGDLVTALGYDSYGKYAIVRISGLTNNNGIYEVWLHPNGSSAHNFEFVKHDDSSTKIERWADVAQDSTLLDNILVYQNAYYYPIPLKEATALYLHNIKVTLSGGTNPTDLYIVSTYASAVTTLAQVAELFDGTKGEFIKGQFKRGAIIGGIVYSNNQLLVDIMEYVNNVFGVRHTFTSFTSDTVTKL